MKKIIIVVVVFVLGCDLQAMHKPEGVTKKTKKVHPKAPAALMLVAIKEAKKDKDALLEAWLLRGNDECPVCGETVRPKLYERLSDACYHLTHSNCKKDWYAFSGCKHCPLCKVKDEDSSEVLEDQVHVLVTLAYKAKYKGDLEAHEIYSKLLNQLSGDEQKEIGMKAEFEAGLLYSANEPKWGINKSILS